MSAATRAAPPYDASRMRIVIAGGGTGGHTSAGLAVAAALAQRGVEVHWIGSRGGVEARRAPEAGVAFHAISTGKLRRYWAWQNVPDLSLRVPAGFAQSWRLLRRLKPRQVRDFESETAKARRN